MLDWHYFGNLGLEGKKILSLIEEIFESVYEGLKNFSKFVQGINSLIDLKENLLSNFGMSSPVSGPRRL